MRDNVRRMFVYASSQRARGTSPTSSHLIVLSIGPSTPIAFDS